MAFTNNVMIVRHGLLAKLVKMWNNDTLIEEIDRLPINLSPRKSKVKGRCCVTLFRSSLTLNPWRQI